jgi:hypothetical protein
VWERGLPKARQSCCRAPSVQTLTYLFRGGSGTVQPLLTYSTGPQDREALKIILRDLQLLNGFTQPSGEVMIAIRLS